MGAGFDLYGRRRDGSEFPVDISLSPLDTDEGTLIAASVRDVTDRRQAEEDRALLQARLQQAQRLESLGQLAGGVAHDFNNLLVVIQNYAEFLSEALTDAGETEMVDDVGEILQAAERAARLTHQLLVFGRREFVRPQVVDVNAIITEFEGILARALGEHIDFGLDLCESLPAVHADPGSIEQVLMNLVINARDAMPEGGRIRITTSRVPVLDASGDAAGGSDTADRSDNCVEINVADTGIGMTRRVAERAFEPFFTTKEAGRGAGLGLATVHGIVTQAGGDVSVISELGRGTTVRVSLPATSESPAHATGREREADMDGAETVLVVEDEAQVRELARKTLERHGYTVLTAADAPRAIEIADDRAGGIDLLLTDVIMPGMNGRELATALRAEHGNIKVVFMSGYPQDVIPAGVLSDAIDLVEKPFTAHDLLAHVRASLDRS